MRARARVLSAARMVSVILAAALALGPVVPAFADIYAFEDEWVSTSTNPGAPDEYTSVWREGWGNDPLAKFTIAVPQPNPGQPAIVGGVYAIVRPDPSMIDTITVDMWPDCYVSPVTTSQKWNLTIDVIGEDANPGPYFGPTGMVPGALRTFEGPFAVLCRMYADGVTDAAFGMFGFGLDVTPPAKVTNLVATPGYGDAPVNGYLKQSRVHLSWEDKLYDTLSGTGYFELFLDGKPYPLSKGSEVSRKVFDLREHFWAGSISVPTPRQTTIEDLPAGKHTLQVRAVDRATNPGPLSDPITFAVDPDIPDITVTWPSVNGQIIGVTPTFKANVVDLGGVKSVKFYVDGVYKATDTAAPYQATVGLGSFANGSSHVLRVVAEDMAGRTNFAEQSFVIDKSLPVATVTSSGPGTFSPRKREGYKDNYVVKFKSNEVAKATMTIKDSSGKVWRTMTKNVPIGASSFTWNGLSNSGSMKQGSFKWYLKLTDGAGNASSTKSGTATIKYYEFIQTSGNTVKVVER